MGQTTDGSTAAQGALEDPYSNPNGAQLGFFGRLFSALSPSETAETDGQDTPAGGAAPALPAPGMSNPRRMRVDDVAIPKAEIVAVPVTTPKEALVEVFRESGFSRLPVFKSVYCAQQFYSETK